MTLELFELTQPIWNSTNSLYTFNITSNNPKIQSKSICKTSVNLSKDDFPDLVISGILINMISERFIELSKKWFNTPLKKENFIKRLRHKFEMKSDNLEINNKWINYLFELENIEINSKEIILNWNKINEILSEPLIPSNFIAESRPSSPELNLRTIQITNTLDSNSSNLIPFEDLPFSEQLPWDENSKIKEKRKIREARLRVALAKLKAERLANNYFSRYGKDDNSDSSELTSESDLEEDRIPYS